MNFNIVDGNDDCMILVDEFARLYSDRSLNVPELCRVLGINRGEYRKLRRHCHDEGLIRFRNEGHLKRKKRNRTTHIYRTPYGYNIKKTLDGKPVYYGTYRDYRDAERVVEELKRVDWDKSQLESIKRRVLNKC